MRYRIRNTQYAKEVTHKIRNTQYVIRNKPRRPKGHVPLPLVYQEKDKNGKVINGHQSKECKSFYLPLDNLVGTVLSG